MSEHLTLWRLLVVWLPSFVLMHLWQNDLTSLPPSTFLSSPPVYYSSPPLSTLLNLQYPFVFQLPSGPSPSLLFPSFLCSFTVSLNCWRQHKGSVTVHLLPPHPFLKVSLRLLLSVSVCWGFFWIMKCSLFSRLSDVRMFVADDDAVAVYFTYCWLFPACGVCVQQLFKTPHGGEENISKVFPTVFW